MGSWRKVSRQPPGISGTPCSFISLNCSSEIFRRSSPCFSFRASIFGLILCIFFEYSIVDRSCFRESGKRQTRTSTVSRMIATPQFGTTAWKARRMRNSPCSMRWNQPGSRTGLNRSYSGRSRTGW